MALLRVSRLAKADLASILTTSLERWGESGRARYEALLATAMQRIAADAVDPLTRDHPELRPGMRSFHIRHVRREHGVGAPVHVLYYRATDEGAVEIIRVLHERMEPQRHLGPPMKAIRARRSRRR
jgi:toxin ParE1/3/4